MIGIYLTIDMPKTANKLLFGLSRSIIFYAKNKVIAKEYISDIHTTNDSYKKKL